MKRALDITIAVALWFALGGFLGGCGDAPSPCELCPAGTQCRRAPSERLLVARWECVKVVKTVEMRPLGLTVEPEPEIE